MAIALAVVVPAQGASYPNGGSDFGDGEQGWVPATTECTPIGAPLCTTSAVHEPAEGNPAGSITFRLTATANLFNTVQGSGTWTSPVFTIPAGQAVTAATFQYDRQLVGSLINLVPESDVSVDLVEVGGPERSLMTETLNTANEDFTTTGVGIPPAALVPGESYQLRIGTVTRTTAVSIGTGPEDTRFDNVVLAVDQAPPAGGGGNQAGTTPIVSEGVTVTKSFRTDSQINALFGRFDEGTKVGHGPGGSVVPLQHCTIVGTRGADRITGTRGNDVICGLGGNDLIKGAGGVDIIDGANGRDRLAGGAARDKLIGLRGSDRLNGNAGNDRIGGGAGHDRLNGARGRDRIAARDRTRDRVNGGPGRDRAKVDRLAAGARRTAAARRRADRVVRVERVS